VKERLTLLIVKELRVEFNRLNSGENMKVVVYGRQYKLTNSSA
jgi:hypothetical protein